MHSTIKDELKSEFDKIQKEIVIFVHRKRLKISKIKEKIHEKINLKEPKEDEKSENIRRKLEKKFTKIEKMKVKNI